mmetsp:Transcript_24150/g.45168  ORF Transcript_24150/g.45168 Transcript_24150/m.45168 type:complete len:232 (-) Transcript_24150:1475-2170(-)
MSLASLKTSVGLPGAPTLVDAKLAEELLDVCEKLMNCGSYREMCRLVYSDRIKIQGLIKRCGKWADLCAKNENLKQVAELVARNGRHLVEFAAHRGLETLSTDSWRTCGITICVVVLASIDSKELYDQTRRHFARFQELQEDAKVLAPERIMQKLQLRLKEIEEDRKKSVTHAGCKCLTGMVMCGIAYQIKSLSRLLCCVAGAGVCFTAAIDANTAKSLRDLEKKNQQPHP